MVEVVCISMNILCLGSHLSGAVPFSRSHESLCAIRQKCPRKQNWKQLLSSLPSGRARPIKPFLTGQWLSSWFLKASQYRQYSVHSSIIFHPCSLPPNVYPDSQGANFLDRGRQRLQGLLLIQHQCLCCPSFHKDRERSQHRSC